MEQVLNPERVRNHPARGINASRLGYGKMPALARYLRLVRASPGQTFQNRRVVMGPPCSDGSLLVAATLWQTNDRTPMNTRRRIWNRALLSTLAAVLTLLLLPSTSLANSGSQSIPETATDAAPGEVVISVLGEVAPPSGLGDTGWFLTYSHALSGPSLYDGGDGPAEGAYDFSSHNPVLYSWRDRDGWMIRFRKTAHEKATQKHGLTVRTVKRSTQLGYKTHQSGTAYKYEAYAREYSCSWWRCKKIREQLIRVPVEFRLTYDGKYYGVITAYCPPYTGKCPSWVNTHIN